MNSATCESAVRDAPGEAWCVRSSCTHIQIEMLADIVRATRHMLAREARGGAQAAVHGECMRAGETRSSTAIDQAEEERMCGDADGLSKLEQGGGGGTGGGSRGGAAPSWANRAPPRLSPRRLRPGPSPILAHSWTAVDQGESGQLAVGFQHLSTASHGRQGESRLISQPHSRRASLRSTTSSRLSRLVSQAQLPLALASHTLIMKRPASASPPPRVKGEKQEPSSSSSAPPKKKRARGKSAPGTHAPKEAWEQKHWLESQHEHCTTRILRSSYQGALVKRIFSEMSRQSATARQTAVVWAGADAARRQVRRSTPLLSSRRSACMARTPSIGASSSSRRTCCAATRRRAKCAAENCAGCSSAWTTWHRS
jgi:hypothetical protein